MKAYYVQKANCRISALADGVTSSEFRAIRRQLGLNQTELADRLGMTQPMVSRIERGDREPTNQQGAAILLLRELLTQEERI